jgi:hypothetical protein
MIKSYTIARKTSCYLPKAFADFVESAAVHKFNRNDKVILLSDDDVTSNLIEIVARLLQYQNNPADIPAYLRHDLLEWLRNHG